MRPQTTVQIRQTSPVVRPAAQTNKNLLLTSPSSSTTVGQKGSAVATTANVVATASIQLKTTATTNNIVLNNSLNNNSNLSVNNLNNEINFNNKTNSHLTANSIPSSSSNTATQIVINSNNTKSNLNNNSNKLLLNSNSLSTVNSKSIAITSHSIAQSPVSITPTIVHNNKTIHDKKSQNSSASSLPAIKSIREKSDKKLFASTANASGSVAGSGSGSAAMVSAYYPTIYGDDDINDVAAMGGVNLAEESQRILGSTEFVGTQIRSCKDEVFLNLPTLQQKIRACMAKHGLDEPSSDVSILLSHATQEHLKNIVEKLAVIAEHRIDILKVSFGLILLS